MRCYHLCNFYLSSIQQGIQSAHSQMELFVKYEIDSLQKTSLVEWAKFHKTMIVLNGGMLSDMVKSLEFLNTDENIYPWAPFNESEEALGGILTNIAIVLPEKIYLTAEWIRKKIVSESLDTNKQLSIDDFDYIESKMAEFGPFSDYEIELCKFMNTFGLAK